MAYLDSPEYEAIQGARSQRRRRERLGTTVCDSDFREFAAVGKVLRAHFTLPSYYSEQATGF